MIGGNGERSSWESVNSGVPQGSVLGPLLFCLYVNDLWNVMKNCKHALYADDLQIYLHCLPSELEDGIEKVKADVEAIYNWTKCNFISFNISKSKAMIIGSNRYISSIKLDIVPKIIVNDSIAIPYVESARCLGVTISNTLSWNNHVSDISNSIYKSLYQLRLHKDLLPVPLRRQLVSTLIFPYLDYCCLVYADLTAELNLKLKRSLNSCVRFILNVRKDEHITAHYHELGWLNVEFRRKYFKGNFLYQLFRTQTPRYLFDMFTAKGVLDLRTTRTVHTRLYIPTYRTATYQNSFFVTACRLWNDLPTDLTNRKTIFNFRFLFYDYLLQEFRRK